MLHDLVSRAARVGVMLLALGGLACGALVDLAAPAIHHNGILMLPHAEYALWWNMTEQCSGRRGSFEAIHWYIEPDAYLLADRDALGEESSLTDRIVLAGHSVDNGYVVRHEMLHALISEHGHPAEYFQQKCGGVLACPESCAGHDDARSASDSAAPLISADDLELTSSLYPAVPSTQLNGGWFALTVEVRNPHPFTVRVRLDPSHAGQRTAVTFGYQESFCNGDRGLNLPRYESADTILFMAPNEVRRAVFDIVKLPVCYRYQPFFNDQMGSVVQLEATP